MKKNVVNSNTNYEFKILGLSLSEIILIIVNLIPLFGVIFYRWQLYTILMLYFIECIILIIYSLIKFSILAIYFNKKSKSFVIKKSRIIDLFNFIVFFVLIFLYIKLISSLTKCYDCNLSIFEFFITYRLVILSFIISHGVSFYINFILKEIKRIKNPDKIFDKILGRLAMFYLVLIIGISLTIFLISIISSYFLKPFINSPLTYINYYLYYENILSRISSIILISIFVIVKGFIDLINHRREHNFNIEKQSLNR